ncbi:MAG: hypothetical protein KF684_08955 [Phycisphaeraceae bacterium]|nr:hypothetical protein [Phycisphaeraceae bacterium]
MTDSYEVIDAGSSQATWLAGLCWITTTEDSVAWGPPARPWRALAITAVGPLAFLSLLAIGVGWFAKSTGAFDVMHVVATAIVVIIFCFFIAVIRAVVARNAPVIVWASRTKPEIRVHGQEYLGMIRDASAFISVTYWIEGGAQKIRRQPILLRLSLEHFDNGVPLYIVLVDNAWPGAARKLAREIGVGYMSVRVGPAPSQREAIRRAIERVEARFGALAGPSILATQASE